MLSLDGWTVFFTIVNVLVLFIGLKVFLFKPVLNIIRQREEMIGQQFAEAAKKEQDAQQMKEEYQEKLKEAGRKAEEIVLPALAGSVVVDARPLVPGRRKRARTGPRGGEPYPDRLFLGA